MRRIPGILLLLSAAAAVSCSTTRVLQDGEYRLVRNTITQESGPKVPSSQLSPYIRQKAQSWNPFIYVYNWSKKPNGVFHNLGTPPTVFDSTAMNESLANLERRLEYLGYYNSGVRSTLSVKRKKAYVNYIVNVGKEYEVKSLSFDIPNGGDFHTDFITDTLAAQKALLGKRLAEEYLSEESLRSSTVLRNKGYFTLNRNNYSFEADTLADGTASLIYRVREYTRNEKADAAQPLRKFRIGDVSISHPESLPFRSKVLLDLNTIKPGDIYSEQTVNNTYSRLSSLNVFGGVNVRMNQSDTATVDCRISMTPTKVQGVKVKLEASANSNGLFSVSPNVSYYHKNIFHGGEWLKLAFSGDFQYRPSDKTRAVEYGISAGLSFPKFLGLPNSVFKRRVVPRTDLDMSFNRQHRPEFSRNSISLSFAYKGTSVKNLSYQLSPLRVNFVRLYDVDPEFYDNIITNPLLVSTYTDHIDAGVSATIYYNSSRDLVPKETYHFHRFTVDLSGNVLSLFNSLMPQTNGGAHTIAGAPYAQYVRGEYSWGKVWRYGQENRQAVALRLLAGAGYAYGNSYAMPLEKQFYAGGASSMRGWQARCLGPGSEPYRDVFAIPSQTGDMKLEANLEYRFGIFWKIEGALFTDMGNVWNFYYGYDDGSEFRFNEFYKQIAADWGFGIRVNLDFLLLRLDFGMKLYDPSRPEGERIIGADKWFTAGHNALHFGVGYPF